MGYTHYWYLERKDIPPKTWKTILKDFNNVLHHNKLYNLISHTEDYQIDDEVFRFNGTAEYGYETFHVERRYVKDSYEQTDEQGRYFSFCKTAQNPYDIVVQIALILLKYHLGDKINVLSDGELEDWKQACKLVGESINEKWEDIAPLK